MYAKWIEADGRFAFSLDDNGGVEIPDVEHRSLLEAQSNGKDIVRGEGGVPVALDPPPLGLEEFRVVKLAEIDGAFTTAATALTAGYPEAERLTWPVQQAEALAWGADADAPTPYLDGVAAARGIDPADMRQRTLDQVQLFMAASQQLVGRRQRLRDEAHAAASIEELQGIAWPAE